MATLAWKANLSRTQGFARVSPEAAVGRQAAGHKPTVLSFECMEDRKLLSITAPLQPDGLHGQQYGGAGSLRDAIIWANADIGKTTDIIQLQAGTYVLSLPNGTSGHETASQTGDLNITSTAHQLIIDGHGNFRTSRLSSSKRSKTGFSKLPRASR